MKNDGQVPEDGRPLDRLAQLIDLPIYDLGEDWDLVGANADRIEDFCDVYEDHELNDVEKRELMMLIVASCDDYVDEHKGALPASWDRVTALLSADLLRHQWLIDDWACVDETGAIDLDPNHGFPLTPAMQQLHLRLGSG